MEKTFLSLSGRIYLIHSCFSHISNYLCFFKILVLVVLKMKKLQRNFLWLGAMEDKKDHLISWHMVCMPKESKGLCFGKTCLKNFTLLRKWLWRVPMKSSTLWHQVISSIRGTHSN